MWVEYKDGGTYTYYDGELVNDDGTIGGNVILGEKIAFLYVAHTFSLVGFNKPKNSFMYSNEVSSTAHPFTLTMMKDKTVIVEGLWKEKKETFQGAGCKFGINLYALIKIGDKYQRCCIKTHGGPYGAWSDFIAILGGATQSQIDAAKNSDKKLPFTFTERGYIKVEQGAVAVTGHQEKKNGNVTFTVPMFKFIDKVSEEANSEAIAFDVELQEYLKARISSPAPAEASDPEPTPCAATPQTAAPAQGQTPVPNPPAGNNPPPPTEEDMAAMYGEDSDNDFESDPF